MSYKKKKMTSCKREVIGAFEYFSKDVLGAGPKHLLYLCQGQNLFLISRRVTLPEAVKNMVTKLALNLVGIYAGRVAQSWFEPSIHLAFTIRELFPFEQVLSKSIEINNTGTMLFLKERPITREFFYLKKPNRHNIYLVINKDTKLPIGWGKILFTDKLIPLRTPSILMHS